MDSIEKMIIDRFQDEYEQIQKMIEYQDCELTDEQRAEILKKIKHNF